MPSIHYRTTFVNPLTLHKQVLSGGHDMLKMRAAAAEHLEHARHARERGDYIAVAYHESRHAYLSSTKGKLATLMAARTGLQVGRQSGEMFGLNIKKGFLPNAHTHTRTLFRNKSKGSSGGSGGPGIHHDPHSGRFT